MNELYTLVKSTCLYISAAASVIGAFKIYQKWNRGENVFPLILAWVFGTGLVTIIFYMIDIYIVQGGYKSVNPASGAQEFALEIFETTTIIGVAISIFSIISIYKKYNDGEDVYDLIVKWVGSLLFLFFSAYLIEFLLS